LGVDEDVRLVLLAAAKRAAPAVPGGLAEDLAEAQSVLSPRLAYRLDLGRIYEIRLARWQAERVPNCDGLPEFVGALRDGQRENIHLSWFSTQRNTWLILLGLGLESIDAAIRINHPPRVPPAADAHHAAPWDLCIAADPATYGRSSLRDAALPATAMLGLRSDDAGLQDVEVEYLDYLPTGCVWLQP
jgi:hypothetical protein